MIQSRIIFNLILSLSRCSFYSYQNIIRLYTGNTRILNHPIRFQWNVYHLLYIIYSMTYTVIKSVNARKFIESISEIVFWLRIRLIHLDRSKNIFKWAISAWNFLGKGWNYVSFWGKKCFGKSNTSKTNEMWRFTE